MHRHHVISGIDQLSLADPYLHNRRVGLMTNQTGVNHELESSISLISRQYNLTALFAVEHGIRGDIQAGEQVDNTVDSETGVPVFSTYGKNSCFTSEMLDAFDVLVFDIQDVGARFYTYLYSLSRAMEACNRAHKSIVVLDRINPLGGLSHSGTILDLRFASFVGNYELPTQYALTIGEYALYVKNYLKLSLPVSIIPLSGWNRSMRLDDTDIPWVAPSPNCANLDTALCYPGTCIFEGTNISEGRGTTMPFQYIGAPWLNSAELEARMQTIPTPGIHFRRVSFTPTFSKHTGTLCHGVQMHILDRNKADVFAAGLLLLDEIRKLSGDAFSFISFDSEHFFIDQLLGTDVYRTGIMTAHQLIESSREPVAVFIEKSRSFHLYD